MPVTSITRSPGCWPPPPARRVSPGTPAPKMCPLPPECSESISCSNDPQTFGVVTSGLYQEPLSDTLNVCFGHFYRRAVGRAAHPHSVRRQHVVHRDGRGECRHVVQVHLKRRTPRTNSLSSLEGYTSFINPLSRSRFSRAPSGHRARTLPRPLGRPRQCWKAPWKAFHGTNRYSEMPLCSATPRARGQRDGTTTSVPSRLRNVE
jgi:hypothetical protein